MLTFDQVTKQFTAESFGVSDISFEIGPGEFVFVTGPSGSGKTTLMRLLTKEYTPTTGDIIFENLTVNNLRSSQVHQLRRKIGVVFQDYRLLSELNVWENVALPLYIIGKKQVEIEERVTDLLKLVELTDKALLFPSQLSGGEAQRISIARALATGPSIIFADEPTGNLDAENSMRIAKLLHKINELGTTILFATHDGDVLAEFKNSRILHLEKGKLIKDGGKKKVNVSSHKLEKDEKEPTDEKEETDKKAGEANQIEQEDQTTPDVTTNKSSKKGVLGRLFNKNKQTDSLENSKVADDEPVEQDAKPEQAGTDDSPKKKKRAAKKESEDK